MLAQRRYGVAVATTLSAGTDNVLNKTCVEHVSAETADLVDYMSTTKVNEPGRTYWVQLDLMC